MLALRFRGGNDRPSSCGRNPASWRRETQRLIRALHPDLHFSILRELYSFFRLGKRVIGAEFHGDDHSASALWWHLGAFHSETLDRTVISVRPPKADEVLAGKAGMGVPNPAGFL